MTSTPSPSKLSAPGRRWTHSDFATDPESLARRLLGQRLVAVSARGVQRTAGIIVETEAYLGIVDKAAHSYNGRRTLRNESMWGGPGIAYVYFTYGMHHCFNVVCGNVGEPVAVLVRALEPVEGITLMRRRRLANRSRPHRPLPERELCAGPAKLCQALAIDRRLDGVDLSRSLRLWIEHGPNPPSNAGTIAVTSRIGVGYAQEWSEAPLRFLLVNSRCTSR